MTEIMFSFDDILLDSIPRDRHVPENIGLLPERRRRVVGRQGGEVVSVTDLPPHFVHPRETPPAMQYLVTVEDYVTWLVQTLNRTRFTGPAATFDEESRFEIARSATTFGITEDLDGNVTIPDLQQIPLGQKSTRTEYGIDVRGFGAENWAIIDGSTGDTATPGSAEWTEIRTKQLWDVATAVGDPFTLTTKERA